VNVIAVDDEQLALTDLQEAIREVLPESNLLGFDTPDEALNYAKTNHIHIAFLDINMGGMSGLQLAKHLKELNGNTKIIFVTGYAQYALDAFSLYASGYLLKPIDVKAVFEAVEHLSCPVKQPADKRLHVQTFGNFEAFVDGKPLCFARSKTKELFAYLVYRQGALCSNNEVIAVLWEDVNDSEKLHSYFRQLIVDLTKTLESEQLGDILFKQRGAISVLPDNFSCDLYDFFKNKNDSNYRGEFMAQYSWAEYSNAFLQRSFQLTSKKPTPSWQDC